MSRCEQPFWENPGAVIQEFKLSYKANCMESKANFVVRLLILGLVLGMIGLPLAGNASFAVAIGLAAVIAGLVVYTGAAAEPVVPVKAEITNSDGSKYVVPLAGAAKTEGFANIGRSNGTIVSDVVGVEARLPSYNDAAPYNGPALPDSVLPTARNLFMNVLVDEYKYNPDRPAAAPVSDPLVKQTLDDYFRVQWFSDPTDVFGKNQNQRQFVTQPSTSIPNDRESYQNWLYKIPGKTCKEGGRDACLAGTDGGAVTWLNQAY